MGFCYHFVFFITRLIYFKLQINILFLQVANFLRADRRHIHSANISILIRPWIFIALMLLRVCTNLEGKHVKDEVIDVNTDFQSATDTKQDILPVFHHMLLRTTD